MKIIIKNLQKKIPISHPKTLEIKRAVQNVLSAENVKKPGEITISFVTDKEIKKLNLYYLGRNIPTDVLAFDIAGPGEPARFLADIIVSCDTAARQARIFKTTPLFETCLYVIHGILHLLGYDDLTQTGRKIMEEKAYAILNKIKVDN